ncbi:methyltransferase family protein [Bacteroidota bacterium]
MSNFASKVFKNRGYTPIPFLILMLIFQKASPLSLIIGLPIALLGAFFRFWGISYAGSETRTTGAVGGTYLIISGAFAYVRNPLYLGNILMYLGIGIMSMALFPYLQITALFFFYWQYRVIIGEEEKYLIQKFGHQFEEYVSAVPRFIPRLIPYKNENVEQPPLNIKGAVKSETRTWQAFLTVIILLLVIYLVF